MTDRELMQQALEALGLVVWTNNPPVNAAITALRERLAREEQEPWEQLHPDMGNPFARQEQEPVAWEDVLGAIARGWTHEDNKHKTMDVPLVVAIAKEVQDMCPAPQRREWVGLTDEGINRLWSQSLADTEGETYLPLSEFARAIEAKLKEKNQ